MNANFVVGTASAGPGEKGFGTLEVPGTGVTMPVAVIQGRTPGPCVCITAGVHGAEYVGIEAAIRTIGGLDPLALSGTVVVVPVVNTPAFAARSIYVCPLDGRNLNRVFPGSPEGTPSERMAHALFASAIRRADAYVDLHGGDLNEALLPFTIYFGGADPGVVARSRAMAEAFGISHIIEGTVPGSAFEAAAAAGIPSVLPEAGGQGILDESMVQIHLRGIRNVLATLRVIPGAVEPAAPPVHVKRFLWLRSDHAGLFYPRVAVGDSVAEGELLGEIRDWFGRQLALVTSPTAGSVLFLVTTPATNPGDPLLAIGA